MPTTESIPDAQSTDVPDCASSFIPPPTDSDAVTELVNAAEALAILRLKVVPSTRNGASGPVVSDTEICGECERGQVLSGMAHSGSCGVGRVLAACAVLRKSGALAVYSEAYRRGWGDGQQRAFEQMSDRLKVTADEAAQARPRLEAVTSSTFHGPTVAIDAERARQIRREFELAARLAPQRLPRPVASWDHGDFASAIEKPERKVVCGRAIVVFGHPSLDVFTCDLEPGHGDAWHDDRTAGRKWIAEATEIHFHPSGMVETRVLGREPEFDYSTVPEDAQ